MVAVEIEAVEQAERHLRAVELGDGDGPVERDDVGRREAEQLVVERDDLATSRCPRPSAASVWTALIAACSW